MTAQTIADLRRELEKARIALIGAQSHLAAHAEANAALHCAATVLYSPLHSQVTAAIGQIEHALERTEQAYIDATTAPAPDQLHTTLREVLAQFVHKTHPGRPCLQSNHVNTETVERWRAVLYPKGTTQ